MFSQRRNLYFCVLVVLLGVAIILDLSFGSANVSLSDLFAAALGNGTEQNQILFWQFRLPRMIAGLLGGMSLGLSGLLMQTFFRNPIAGPFVLGITSGASLGVALVILGFSALGISGFFWDQLGVVPAALCGSLLVLFLIMLISGRTENVSTLLIIGLMIGSFVSAFVSLLQYFSGAIELKRFVIWTMGSLAGIDLHQSMLFAALVLPAVLACFLLVKDLNTMLFGEEEARDMGLDVKKGRNRVVIITCLLAGVTTAYCGPIAFLGIAIPHLARWLFLSNQHRILVPAVALLGSTVLILCDLVAQIPGSEMQLPINAVTSFIGAPAVVWIVLKRSI